MDIVFIISAYLILTVFFVFVLLFGENVVFRHTPVSLLHWLITQGSWDAIGWLIAKGFGARGSAQLAEFMDCCDRPNPVLQAMACTPGSYSGYCRTTHGPLPITCILVHAACWSASLYSWRLVALILALSLLVMSGSTMHCTAAMAQCGHRRSARRATSADLLAPSIAAHVGGVWPVLIITVRG
ncbi:hypothetical protein CEUSTIGMA_g9710.t1 [Chlamydomonas eustigma]|uniref:Uncharacterized protein n=1 Tax=Chlamydomonas eustigma TaxID=1157962 RepID=A0A250XGS8_9CHLO|nr:hypothetical protein CEUSTIGMA_g9710.t1 [Chlamydomonas eustigma]|eukprot:GAX82281.1 hypothetical protein CEUSTIGMA_g9710.t1 [Chlamydomonas eustigma]